MAVFSACRVRLTLLFKSSSRSNTIGLRNVCILSFYYNRKVCIEKRLIVKN